MRLVLSLFDFLPPVVYPVEFSHLSPTREPLLIMIEIIQALCS